MLPLGVWAKTDCVGARTQKSKFVGRTAVERHISVAPVLSGLSAAADGEAVEEGRQVRSGQVRS